MEKNSKMKFQPEGYPDTPYARARMEYDEIVGSARVQAKNWRLFGLVSLSVALVSILGLIVQSTKSSVIPYIVEVDDHGSVQLVGRADQRYKPNDAAAQYFICQFISQIRSIPTDPVVMRNNFLTSYNYVTSKGRNTLNAYAKEQDPFKHLGQKAVSVEIKSAVKISENTYQIQWDEQEFGNNGNPLSRKRYMGVFNLQFLTPKNEQMIRLNPLGIYIDFFNISQVS